MLAWSGFYSVSKSEFSVLASCDVIENQDISITNRAQGLVQRVVGLHQILAGNVTHIQLLHAWNHYQIVNAI